MNTSKLLTLKWLSEIKGDPRTYEVSDGEVAEHVQASSRKEAKALFKSTHPTCRFLR